jgi:hypothetical protein
MMTTSDVDATASRTDIAHLRSLAKSVTDPRTLVAISELIHEWELQLLPR